MSLCHIVRLDGYIQSSYLAVYPDKLMLLDGCCRLSKDDGENKISESIENQLKLILFSPSSFDTRQYAAI